MAPSSVLGIKWLVVYTLVVLLAQSNYLVALPIDRQSATSHLRFTSDGVYPRAQEHFQPMQPAKTFVEKAKNLAHNIACMGSCKSIQVEPYKPPPVHVLHPSRLDSGWPLQKVKIPPRRRPPVSIMPPPAVKAGPLKIGQSASPSPLSAMGSQSKSPSAQVSENYSGSFQDKGKGKMPVHSPSSSTSSSPEHTQAGPSGTKA